MSHQDAAGMLKMNCSVVQLKTSLSMAGEIGLMTFKFPFQPKLFYGPEHIVCLPGHPGTPEHAMVHQRGWGAVEGAARERGPWVAQLVGCARGFLPSKNAGKHPAEKTVILEKEAI